jgi:hypothetical protein
MKRLVTGVDASGCSCVVEETEFTGEPRQDVYRTASNPPPPRPLGTGEYMDLAVPPGLVWWLRSTLSPHAERAMHHTDSVDMTTVIVGHAYLGLGDGEHRLDVGDSVVLTGVDHSMRAGPEGCVLSAVIIGTTPRND